MTNYDHLPLLTIGAVLTALLSGFVYGVLFERKQQRRRVNNCIAYLQMDGLSPSDDSRGNDSGDYLSRLEHVVTPADEAFADNTIAMLLSDNRKAKK